MSRSPVVCNSSPLIALEQIGHLDILERLFGAIVIPEAVAHETSPTVVLPPWVISTPLSQPITTEVASATLGPGESEAISLSLEIGAALVILDDRPARKLAKSLGLSVIGVLGLLLAAKKQGFIPAVKPSMDALLQHGFHVSAELYKLVLSDAGESP